MTWNHNTPPLWYRRATWHGSWSKRNGVHYVGDDLTVDFGWASFTAQTEYQKVATGFEWGTDGAVITATDRELATPFGGVSGSPTYSSTHAHGGSQSMKIPASSATVETGYSPTINGDLLDQYGRLYLYMTQNPSVSGWLVRTQQSAIHIATDGKVKFGVFSLDYSTVASIALNQWVRIEWRMKWDAVQANTIFEVKLFNDPDSGTPTEVVTQPNSLLQASNSSCGIGARGNNPTTPWGTDFWIDDIVVGADAYPGPYSATEYQPPANPITYSVLDFYGETITEGTFEEGLTWFRPIPPDGGWQPGWYRLYLTGPETAANYESSYGVTNFCVVRDDAHFVPMPIGSTDGSADNGANDFIMKGVMGLGTSRHSWTDASDTTTQMAGVLSDVALTDTYWADPGAPYADSERPRYQWLQFPNRTVDYIDLPGAVSGTYGRVYAKDETINGTTTFVEVTPGSGSGDRVRVYSPDNTTLVETYDNLASAAAAKTAINAASNYIRFFEAGQSLAADLAKTALGTAYSDGVSTIVAAVYAAGCIYFEGPYNEPPMNDETAHQMRLFQAAVHDGHASAKALGPCPVATPPMLSWNGFFDAGGGAFCDEISFHAYNSATNGDMNLGKNIIPDVPTLLAGYGLSSKPLWQTESTHAGIIPYGIYHPRRARKLLMDWMLFEQSTVTRERNNPWYDVSHGFWDFPAWIENGDGSLEPAAVLARVMAEETWGKPYDSALDFGTIGNAIYLGNVYEGPAGKTIVIMATSYMTGASVVLTITGDAGPFTVVDGFGNERLMPPSKGRITLPMTEVPVYVRLPTAASATVYRINGHSPLGIGSSISPVSTTKQIDGVTYAVIADDAYMSDYANNTGIAPTTYATPPSNTTLQWATATTIERVLVWCGPSWQLSGTLVDFDVQTYDGATWTTRKTVTKPSPPWFNFASDQTTSACFEETYWDEQWVFDVELDTAISCLGVRLNVRDASYGGEPLSDAAIANGAGGGQGASVQAYRIQEVAVTDTNRYALVG